VMDGYGPELHPEAIIWISPDDEAYVSS
jgi:hypothetical protein